MLCSACGSSSHPIDPDPDHLSDRVRRLAGAMEPLHRVSLLLKSLLLMQVLLTPDQRILYSQPGSVWLSS